MQARWSPITGTMRAKTAASPNELEWAAGLVNRVRAYTGDDASLSLVDLGFPDFAGLRDQFAGRTHEVLGRYTLGPRGYAVSRGGPEFGRWRREAWEAYRMHPQRGDEAIPFPLRFVVEIYRCA